MKRNRGNATTIVLAVLMLTSAGLAAADPALITARQKFFGIENVDANSGAVKKNQVLFSWVTNSTLAVSIQGRIVLLDTYIQRLELPPPPNVADLRRSPVDVQDLVDLHPEAIFL